MNAPILSKIIDTYIPITQSQPIKIDCYFKQLKTDLIPHIRNLQTQKAINWFCFLFHSYAELHGREPESDNSFIHIKLEPYEGISVEELLNKLPNHFKNPIQINLNEIGGVEKKFLIDKSWANGWLIHGQASEFVFNFLENHDEIPLGHISQFLHFITNPLGVGFKCEVIAGEHKIPF